MNIVAGSQFEEVRRKRGPFVVAAETTRMPMVFTDATDSANPLSYSNDSFLALTGFTKQQILGCPLSIVLTDLACRDKVTAIQGAMALGSEGNWEMECRRIDGTLFQAKVFLSPICDEAGILVQNFLCFTPLGAGYDRQLKRHHELHALYASAPGFIATAEGKDHRFTFANASYKKFVGRNELEGLTVAEALPEIAEQGFVDILDRVFRTGVPYRGTGVAIDITDAETGLVVRRYADFVYQPVMDEVGDIVGLFCEGYDVTGQREATDSLALMQAELIHLSRVNAMGTMAVTLAHELNQPLSAIANYTAGGLRLLDAGAGANAPIARALEAIDEASQRASDIIRTLRELTRRREANHSAFNLKSAVEECIRLVRAATSPNVQIIDRTPPEMTIAADRIQIQQVIINLLRNASDAVMAAEKKAVIVSAATHEGEHMVCISDTGRGVSLVAAQNIFSWSDSTKDGGMGLGLSICRTIIEGHHGRIWLERTGDTGSEFRFALPSEPSRASVGADNACMTSNA